MCGKGGNCHCAELTKEYSSPLREATIAELMGAFIWFALNGSLSTFTLRSMQIVQVGRLYRSALVPLLGPDIKI